MASIDVVIDVNDIIIVRGKWRPLWIRHVGFKHKYNTTQYNIYFAIYNIYRWKNKCCIKKNKFYLKKNGLLKIGLHGNMKVSEQ